jgi:hypothetical protein
LLLKVKPEKAAESLEDEREEYNSETIYESVIDVRFFLIARQPLWGLGYVISRGFTITRF